MKARLTISVYMMLKPLTSQLLSAFDKLLFTKREEREREREEGRKRLNQVIQFTASNLIKIAFFINSITLIMLSLLDASFDTVHDNK